MIRRLLANCEKEHNPCRLVASGRLTKAEAGSQAHLLAKAWETAPSPAEREQINRQIDKLCREYSLTCKWRVVAELNGKILTAKEALKVWK